MPPHRRLIDPKGEKRRKWGPSPIAIAAELRQALASWGGLHFLRAQARPDRRASAVEGEWRGTAKAKPSRFEGRQKRRPEIEQTRLSVRVQFANG